MRYVSCRDNQGGVAEESACAHLPKPPAREVCSVVACGQWKVLEWTAVRRPPGAPGSSVLSSKAAFDYLEFYPKFIQVVRARRSARNAEKTVLLVFEQICDSLRGETAPLINPNCVSSVLLSRCVSSCKVYLFQCTPVQDSSSGRTISICTRYGDVCVCEQGCGDRVAAGRQVCVKA